MIIDSHCDTLLKCYSEKISLFTDEKKLHTNYKKIQASDIALQYFALFIESQYKPYMALEQALKLTFFAKKHLLSNDKFSLVLTQNDLQQLGKKKLALLAIEGAEPIGESLELLEIFFELGIRSIGLTWNERNALAHGCRDTNYGLSSFGKNAVIKMQQLGLIVDCAHLAERGLRDVLEVSVKPIIVSHANCKALHDHPRNLDDDCLRLLAQNGGVIGITFVPYFLSSTNSDINDIVKHILHAINIAGIDHVALGSDFDGCDDLPLGMEGAEAFPCLSNALLKAGLNSHDLNKILYENQLRILRANLPD